MDNVKVVAKTKLRSAEADARAAWAKVRAMEEVAVNARRAWAEVKAAAAVLKAVMEKAAKEAKAKVQLAEAALAKAVVKRAMKDERAAAAAMEEVKAKRKGARR